MHHVIMDICGVIYICDAIAMIFLLSLVLPLSFLYFHEEQLCVCVLSASAPRIIIHNIIHCRWG